MLKTVLFIILSLIVMFLCFRCIILTKTLNYYTSLITNLINDDMTKDNIKIITSAMYGLSVDEIERRLSNGNQK